MSCIIIRWNRWRIRGEPFPLHERTKADSVLATTNHTFHCTIKTPSSAIPFALCTSLPQQRTSADSSWTTPNACSAMRSTARCTSPAASAQNHE